jgi:hypothetical protein
MHDKVERIESVKAGSLSGITAGISYVSIAMIVRVASPVANRLVLPEYSRSLISLGLEAAISIVTGFLFGVTYRYIVRTDRNDHLNSGAVLAFGLVRGLAQIDVSNFELTQIWLNGLIVGKSILLFSIARYLLDLALTAGWILPFSQQIDASRHEG